MFCRQHNACFQVCLKPVNRNQTQKNRVTSIPKNHALAQDNSTPTKQPHFTRDSYPLTPPFRETLRIALHLSKHRSWFSIAEYELSVLSRQCLARRVPDQTFRAADVEARRTARNDVGSRFNWQFTTQDARTRFSRFPSTKLKHIARGYLAVIAKLSTSEVTGIVDGFKDRSDKERTPVLYRCILSLENTCNTGIISGECGSRYRTYQSCV